MAKSSRTIFQLVALVMLLIVFPAASWYYLNSGLQYRRSAMADLGEYGHFPTTSWLSAEDGTSISAEYLDRKMLLVHVLPTEKTQAEQYGNTLVQLHDQFDERNELLFLTLLPGDSTQVAQRTFRFKNDFEIADLQQQLFIRLDAMRSAELQQGFLKAKPEVKENGENLLLLTDTTASIRRYYDIRQKEEVKRLVEHIAMLLPLKKDRELIFKREVEK